VLVLVVLIEGAGLLLSSRVESFWQFVLVRCSPVIAAGTTTRKGAIKPKTAHVPRQPMETKRAAATANPRVRPLSHHRQSARRRLRLA
jgi:hypothetical protein